MKFWKPDKCSVLLDVIPRAGMPHARTHARKDSNALHDLILRHATGLLCAIHYITWSLILDEGEAERTSAILIPSEFG